MSSYFLSCCWMKNGKRKSAIEKPSPDCSVRLSTFCFYVGWRRLQYKRSKKIRITPYSVHSPCFGVLIAGVHCGLRVSLCFDLRVTINRPHLAHSVTKSVQKSYPGRKIRAKTGNGWTLGEAGACSGSV